MEIENRTPWDTKALTALVAPLAAGTTLTKLIFVNHQPHPGVKREKQLIVEVRARFTHNADKFKVHHLTIELLTPKRAKSRTDALERLSYAHDLEPHEVALLPTVTERIVHALKTIRRQQDFRDQYDFSKHLWGTCGCDMAVLNPPLIRGDTQTKTAPPVSEERLKQQLKWAEDSVILQEKRLKKAITKRNRLRARVKKDLSMNKAKQSV